MPRVRVSIACSKASTAPVSSDRIERMIAETDRVLDRAADIVAESGNEQAARLLDRAREHQMQAKRLLGDGQLRAAMAKTRVAAGLAKRAIQLARDGARP